MEKLLENTLWDVPDNKWTLKEDYLNENQTKSVVDGKNILAVVEGCFFVPNGTSRNERYYPKTFWESILGRDDVRERLTSKTMFGEIGHNDRPVSEEDLTVGKVSHIVTKLWVDESTGLGMGQAYILGTPAGRNLYVYMKAGSKIKTSSRASGDFKPNETHEGMPIVDENSYFLETFDFVINPGFLETNPLLKENVDKLKQEMERKDMEFGKELMEHFKEENKTLSESVSELKTSNGILESKNNELNEKISILEAKVAELDEAKEKISNLEGKLGEMNGVSEKLSEYTELGEALEIKETLSKSADMLEAYAKLGKPERIEEKLNEQKEIIGRYKECGSVEDLEETLPVVEHVLGEIAKLGTLEDIKEIIVRANALTESLRKEKFEDLTIKISREYKTPVENVRKLLETVGEEETVEILKAVSETNKKIVKTEVKIHEDVKPIVKTEARNKPLVSEIFRMNKQNLK